MRPPRSTAVSSPRPATDSDGAGSGGRGRIRRGRLRDRILALGLGPVVLRLEEARDTLAAFGPFGPPLLERARTAIRRAIAAVEALAKQPGPR